GLTARSAQKPEKVRLIVQTAKGLSVGRQHEAAGKLGTLKASLPELNLHVIEVPAVAAGFIKHGVNDPDITGLEEDHGRQFQSAPSDSGYACQWALPKICWDQVYGSVQANSLTTVAVLDSGVDASHPDLVGQLVPGTSVVDGSNGTTDENGHGTWVAGIVA